MFSIYEEGVSGQRERESFTGTFHDFPRSNENLDDFIVVKYLSPST
jgi:hypothetical protein